MGLLAFVLLVFGALWLFNYDKKRKKRDKTQPILSRDFHAKILERERNSGFYLILELLEKNGQKIYWRVDANDYVAYRIDEEMTIRLYSRDELNWYSSSDWEFHEGMFGELFDLYTLSKFVPQKFQIS